jgi:hypothetical protein
VRKKKLKIKETNGSQNTYQATSGIKHGKIQQPKRAQYMTRLPLPPYSCFTAELASILLLAFSLFASVAALSQCLYSENPYL